MDLHEIYKIMKVLEENEKNLCDLGLAKDFLDRETRNHEP